jgi:hypothetical protein
LIEFKERTGVNSLTNKQFWQKLSNIMKKPQNDITTVEFIQMLLQGGDEDLAILALRIQDSHNPDRVFQLYAGPTDQRIMLCYTSEAEAKKNKRPLPPNDKRKIKCLPLSVRDVINNALMKDSIIVLAFDSESNHRYIISKELIPMVLETMGDMENGRIGDGDYKPNSSILPS